MICDLLSPLPGSPDIPSHLIPLHFFLPMHPQLEALLDQAEDRYLKPEELGVLNQYIDSLPARLDTYRVLRERELEMLQAIANQLQTSLPGESQETLERSLKHGVLLLRYCSIGMLLNDESFVEERLISWLSGMIQVFDTRDIDTTVYRLLNQQLAQSLNPAQMNFLAPVLKMAETALLKARANPVAVTV